MLKRTQTSVFQSIDKQQNNKKYGNRNIDRIYKNSINAYTPTEIYSVSPL